MDGFQKKFLVIFAIWTDDGQKNCEKSALHGRHDAVGGMAMVRWADGGMVSHASWLQRGGLRGQRGKGAGLGGHSASWFVLSNFSKKMLNFEKDLKK